MANIIPFGSEYFESESITVSGSQRVDILVSNRAYDPYPGGYFTVVVQAQDSDGYWTSVDRITEQNPSVIWVGVATLRFVRQSGECAVDVEVV